MVLDKITDAAVPALGAAVKVIVPTAKVVLEQRKAVRSSIKLQGDLLEQNVAEKYDNLVKRPAEDAKWHTRLLGMFKSQVILTDCLSTSGVQHWLRKPNVKTAFVTITANQVMSSGDLDKSSDEYGVLKEEYQNSTEDPIEERCDFMIQTVVYAVYHGVVAAQETNLAVTQEAHIVNTHEHEQTRQHVSNEIDKLRVSLSDSLSAKLEGTSDPGRGQDEKLDAVFNNQIDTIRDRLNKYPSDAIKDLEKFLEDYSTDDLSKWIKFRVYTNLGAAHSRLEKFNEAKDYYFKAHGFLPNEEKANYNLSYAFLCLGEKDTAAEYARHTIEKFPDSSGAYALYVSSYDGDDQPETKIPKELQSSRDVSYALGRYYQQKHKHDIAFTWMEKAYQADSNSPDIMIGYAETLLHEVFERHKNSIFQPVEFELKIKLDKAVTVLEKAWDWFEKSEIAHKYSAALVNLSNAYRISGELDKATHNAQRAYHLCPNSFDVVSHLAMLHVTQDKPGEAVKVLEVLDEAELDQLTLLYAQALKGDGKLEDAITHIEKVIENSTKLDHEFPVFGLLVLLYAKVGKREDAQRQINEYLRKYPDSVEALSDVSEAYRELGEKGQALEYAQKAYEMLSEECSLIERYLAASCLYFTEQYRKAAEVYSSFVSPNKETPELYRLLVSYLHDDQRTAFKELFAKLPQEIRNISQFRILYINHLIAVGDLEGSNSEIENYIQESGDDLNARLSWMNSLMRQGKDDEVRKFLSNAPEYPDANPADNMTLAQIYDRFAFGEKSLELAYKTVRQNWGQPGLHLAYMGLGILGKSFNSLLAPTEVAVGTTVFLESEKGEKRNYSICNDPIQYRDTELSAEHPIAAALMGQKIGDQVRLDAGQTYEIKSLTSNFTALHLECREKYNQLFPDHEGFYALPDDGTVQPIFKAVDRRHQKAQQVLEQYNSEPIPLNFIAKLLELHPLDLWKGFQADPDVTIYTCDGTSDEREAAKELINTSAQGFIIDPIALYELWTHGLLDAVVPIVVKLGVTQSCIDSFNMYADELRQNIGRKAMTLTKHGDEYLRVPLDDEQFIREADSVSALVNWIKDNCEKVDAVPKDDTDHEARDLLGCMFPDYSDAVIAANGNDWALITEDKRLSLIAANDWGVSSVWLQSLLMCARGKGCLSVEPYYDYLTHCLATGRHYTSIDKNYLLYVLKQNDWRSSKDFEQALAVLCSPKTNLLSSVKVLAGVLLFVWNQPLEIAIKREIMSISLGSLLKGFPDNSQELSRYTFALSVTKVSDPYFFSYGESFDKVCVQFGLPTVFRRSHQKFKARTLCGTSIVPKINLDFWII